MRPSRSIRSRSSRKRRSSRMAAGRDLFGLSAQAKARLDRKTVLGGDADRSGGPAAGRAARGRQPGAEAGRLDVSRLRGVPRNPHDRGSGGLPRHRRPVFPRPPGDRRRRDRDRRPPLHQFRVVQLYRAQRRPAHRRGGEGGDRPLRHLGVGQPHGVRRAPDPPRAGAGAGAHSRRRGCASRWSAAIRRTSR